MALLMAVLAVVLGHIARKETKAGAKAGDGYAVAGLWLGYPLVVAALAAIIGIGGLAGFGSTPEGKAYLREQLSTSNQVLGR